MARPRKFEHMRNISLSLSSEAFEDLDHIATAEMRSRSDVVELLIRGARAEPAPEKRVTDRKTMKLRRAA